MLKRKRVFKVEHALPEGFGVERLPFVEGCIDSLEEHLPAGLVVRLDEAVIGAAGIVGESGSAVAPGREEVTGVPLEIVFFFGGRASPATASFRLSAAARKAVAAESITARSPAS